MLKVYVAGPYSKGNIALNVAKAKVAASDLIDMGFAPFCPHLFHYLDQFDPKPYEVWCDIDNEFVKVCDALLRLPGESSGSDAEEALARSLSIPIFYSIKELCDHFIRSEVPPRTFVESLNNRQS